MCLQTSLAVNVNQKQQLLRWREAYLATSDKLQAARVSLLTALKVIVSSWLDAPTPDGHANPFLIMVKSGRACGVWAHVSLCQQQQGLAKLYSGWQPGQMTAMLTSTPILRGVC